MQEQPLQPHPAHVLIEALLPVFLVARQRMLDVLGVHADLMRAPGEQRHLGQARIGEDVDDMEPRQRRLAVLGDAHHALPALQNRFAQRRVHVETGLVRVPLEQGEILLGGLVFADQLLQPGQRRALFRENEDAAGVTVQAMGEFERLIGP